MYKLVAIDLDGTLLNNQGELSEKHIEAINKAQAQDVIIVIATGRYYMQMEKILHKLNFNGILVSNDGAVIINSESQAIIQEHSFTVEDILPLIHYCRQHHIHFSLTTAFHHYVEWMSPYQIEKCEKYEIRYDVHHNVLDLKETVMKLTIDDERRVNGWQNITLPSYIKVRANAEFFKEYVHIESSKAKGLEIVLEIMNVSPAEVIAIGDFYNDLDMFEYAGLSIAMGNAPDDVKLKADDVTRSNDEDGVYYALAKYLNW